MTEWAKVVTLPLGLAGLAIYLVYLLAKTKSNKPRWLLPAAITILGFAVVGGLFLYHQQLQKANAAAKVQTKTNVQQKSSGQGSPNVQGVQGDVTITVDQSNGKTQQQKPPAREPKPDSSNQ